MNFIIKWLRQCSDCFNDENSSPQIVDYYIKIHCLHISTTKDLICYKCFVNFFGYDRFIIRHLFFYLNSQQTNSIHIKDLSLFARCIINWHEFINHNDFTLLLFHILLSTNNSINSIVLYELINDAFFFTAVQSNVQTNLTNQSQVSFLVLSFYQTDHIPGWNRLAFFGTKSVRVSHRPRKELLPSY
jgi:hypothetical protein